MRISFVLTLDKITIIVYNASMNIQTLPSMFRLAKNISKLSDHQIKMGAVIVKNGHPISFGHNQTKSHPKGWRKGLHCEIQAIRCADVKDFKGATIFIYRENRKTGLPALARPCEHCHEELKAKGFKWMYYSTNEFPFFEAERIK
jgi:tRNA(Arg) A34 adenosine deaminase TadA